MLAGITGLTTSIYSGYYDMYNIVPLFGTVIAGVLIAALSILMIVYGYRLFKRDI
jgi:membrane protein implicated in regulation of membrane protease activity